MSELKWNELTSSAKEWLTGYILTMDKDMNMNIVHHKNLDDSMILYFPIPQCLTKEQFMLTNFSWR